MQVCDPGNLPEFLYRYRAITDETIDREIESISKSTIYGSAFTRLNDPMEGIYAFDNKKLQTPFSEILNLIMMDKLSWRICSFSEEYNNELMWAHYAGQSQGVCIRYNTSALEGVDASVERFLVRVAYKRKPALIRERSDEAILKVLSQKSFRWAKEKEWRVLFAAHLDHNKDVGCALEISRAISSIYIGTRVNESHKSTIIRAVQAVSPGASFQEMKIDGYTMSFTLLRDNATETIPTPSLEDSLD